MKKHCTRIASLALVLALLISTMVPAFAAGAPVAWDDLPESSETAEEPAVLPDGDEETPGGALETEPAAEETPAEEESGIALLAETDSDGFIRGTEEGSNYWWKLENGTLTIKGTKMADYMLAYDTMPDDYIFPPWYENWESTRKIVIQEGITNIGDYAFVLYRSLTGPLTIPTSVTSIGDFAFGDCSGLTGPLTIPAGVTSIGECAFWNCSGLTGSLTIPSSVTGIGRGAFQSCSGLTGALTIPSSMTSIGHGVFDRCSGLTSVTIPDSVKSIDDWAFYECSGLTGPLTIPNSVTSIGDLAFSGCSGLTSVTIPDSVTRIGDSAFSGCSGLTSVTIPDSVTSINIHTFSSCSGLTSVTIPNGVTSIGDSAFWNCGGLTSVTIPNSVKSIGYVTFGNCESLNNILFKGNAPQFDGDYRTFLNVTATAYYPQNNATWTEAVRQNYGGTLTWVPYDPANPPSMEPEEPANPGQPEEPDTPTDLTPGTPNTWQNTDRGTQYLGADGMPLTGSCWIEALGHRYVFDNNGILQMGNADGDLLWEGNQYYLNPDRDPNDPTTCYCVINYTRRREAGVTYYNQDGITYRGWVDGGDGKLLYQTVLRGKDGKELKDEAGFSTYIYVWGGQQIPEGRDPLDKEKTIAAGNYLFGEDGVLVTGKTGWYTIPGSSAIAGEYYLTGTDGQCALNTTIWDDAKGHRYLFGADGRKVSAGKDGRDVALTINGQYQTVYLAPDTDYVACNYYRPRKDSKGGDLGLTYYNPDGITYRGWVDGGNGKRLYQTVMKIEGKDLYFIVWRAQYLPAGKDPVTKDPIPAGWYLFDDNGVLITKDGVYTVPDTKGVNHQYQVKGGNIVAIDGKAPTAPGGK